MQKREIYNQHRSTLGGGHRACDRWTMNVFGIRSTNKLYGAKTDKQLGRDCELRIAVMAWFHEILMTADKMPDTRDYMLPAPHRKAVYDWYKSDNEADPERYPLVSRTYFLAVWRENFPHVKLRKYLRFSKCCFCVLHRAIRWSKKSTKKEKKEAMARLREHYRWIHHERAYARQKQNYAITQPDKYLSIAIDGYLCACVSCFFLDEAVGRCENLSHGVPHFPELTKQDSAVRLRHHLVVAVVHGEPAPTVYHAPENVAHDPNLTIEVLQRTLKRLEKERNGVLPKTLFLQVDNCTRENKNTAVMAYLSWLVERGVFDRIEVSFLPVGHTHNECDQVGSRLAIGVRYAGIATRKAMVEILEGRVHAP